MNTIAHRHGSSARSERGGLWAALLVVAILIAAVWGAWRLGVMASEGAPWRQGLPSVPEALRKTPMPKPPVLPIQRRPAAGAASRG